jgi:hypothetical protein
VNQHTKGTLDRDLTIGMNEIIGVLATILDRFVRCGHVRCVDISVVSEDAQTWLHEVIGFKLAKQQRGTEGQVV